MIKLLAQNKNKLLVSRPQGCNAFHFQESLLQVTLSVATGQLPFKSYTKSKDLIKFQTFVKKPRTPTLHLRLASIYNNRHIQAFILPRLGNHSTFIYNTLPLSQTSTDFSFK